MLTDRQIFQLRNENMDDVADEIETLRDALKQIANGDGYYGAMAREYKNIARAVLELDPV